MAREEERSSEASVVQGMLGLAWRAADETKRWEDAAQIPSKLPKSVAALSP